MLHLSQHKIFQCRFARLWLANTVSFVDHVALNCSKTFVFLTRSEVPTVWTDISAVRVQVEWISSFLFGALWQQMALHMYASFHLWNASFFCKQQCYNFNINRQWRITNHINTLTWLYFFLIFIFLTSLDCLERNPECRLTCWGTDYMLLKIALIITNFSKWNIVFLSFFFFKINISIGFWKRERTTVLIINVLCFAFQTKILTWIVNFSSIGICVIWQKMVRRL